MGLLSPNRPPTVYISGFRVCVVLLSGDVEDLMDHLVSAVIPKSGESSHHFILGCELIPALYITL
jgi:hypothetical protein